jgi:hypothetical protein
VSEWNKPPTRHSFIRTSFVLGPATTDPATRRNLHQKDDPGQAIQVALLPMVIGER